jgi:hypothetical protein
MISAVQTANPAKIRHESGEGGRPCFVRLAPSPRQRHQAGIDEADYKAGEKPDNACHWYPRRIVQDITGAAS